MDNLTAECFFESVRNAIFQATQRSLAKEELVELARTLQLLITRGVPGDAALNHRAKKFCVSVCASGLFFGDHRRENLTPLLMEAGELRAMYARGMDARPALARAPLKETVLSHA